MRIEIIKDCGMALKHLQLINALALQKDDAIELPDDCIKVITPAPAEAEKQLARYQPCGCVVCICENVNQCQGCGAKNCGTHPVGQIPNPIYKEPAEQAEERKQGHSALVVNKETHEIETVDLHPDMEQEKPTLAELEAILNNPNKRFILILMDHFQRCRPYQKLALKKFVMM